MDKIKIIIFDDNASRRDSLKMLITLYDDLEFVGAHEDCSNVIENIKTASPDVVLMDIEMPNVDGIKGVSLIRTKFPKVAVIMQTVFEDDDKIFESIRAGANGYILKKTGPEKVIEAIRDVHAGGAPMSPAIAQRVLQFFQQVKDPQAENIYELTAREKDILAALVDGKSYKMIAAQKEVSYHTVNAHIRKIYDKLHVHSLGEAVGKAIREKLV
jgi:DNA-binding NarL/FixJ family response regulator